MSSPFHQAEEAREISEVNVVPLADVSLVLLIILLVLSPMMTQSMLKVKTAAKQERLESEDLTPPEPQKPAEVVLVVALGPTGLVVGNQFFSDTDRFAIFMRQELARRTDRKVFLAPGPEIAHGMVVRTLELIKSCGAESVALVQTIAEDEDGEIPASQATASPG
ncbi:MAG: biopolymer transporter ExbD [Elusimicrobia bacterium]|nr:biopolymer transporter ExbD [Elusimicrobiota bacterium]